MSRLSHRICCWRRLDEVPWRLVIGDVYLHLLFNSNNNGTNTSVVSGVGRGKSGKPGSVVLQNRSKEVINGHGKINPIANVLMKNMTSNENNGSNVNNDISSVGKKKPSPKVAAIMKASSKAAAALSNTNVSNVLGVNNKNNTKKGKPIPDTDDNVFNVEYPIPESLLKLENESVKEFTKIDGWPFLSGGRYSGHYSPDMSGGGEKLGVGEKI